MMYASADFALSSMENGSLEIGGEGGYRDAEGKSEALAEVLQVLQGCDGAVNALVPRQPSELGNQTTVNFEIRAPTSRQ